MHPHDIDLYLGKLENNSASQFLELLPQYRLV